jgi:hypothetical protein
VPAGVTADTLEVQVRFPSGPLAGEVTGLKFLPVARPK